MTAHADYSKMSETHAEPTVTPRPGRLVGDPAYDGDTAHAIDRTSGRSWDGTWVLRWREVGILVAALLTVIGVGTLVGLTLTDWGAPNAITDLDERVANAFADNRTDLLNDVVPFAAGVADTYIKIGISALICGFFLWKWRRWDEALYVALPLVFEATAFITITSIVQRPRPDVERLLESTINSSYPSGHVAAATVYAAVAVIVFRHTSNRVARTVAVMVVAAIVVAVTWARLYQGMHYLSDVVAGIVLGAVSLFITDRVLRSAVVRLHLEPRPGLGVPAPVDRVDSVDSIDRALV